MIETGSRDDFERIRQSRASRGLPDTDLSGGGVPAFLGQVTSTGSRIAVGDYLLVQPTVVLGDEVEGGPGTMTAVGSSKVPVYLVGPGVPSTGDYLVCRFVENRWVADRMSGGGSPGGGVTLPGCFCSPIPAALTMTSGDTTCNSRMFQNCTLRYGPIPPGFATLNLGSSAFLSTQGFPDPVAGGVSFSYLLTCQRNQFNLTRLYLTSPYGSPYRDGILYTWLVGGQGNTCAPFHLDNGTAFPGSDSSCSVRLDP